MCDPVLPIPERRRHLRSPVNATAILVSGGSYHGPYLVENLSVSGALLRGEPVVPVGERLRMALHLAGVDLPVVATGTVVRHCVEGRTTTFGVAFRALPARALETLQAVLERRTEAREAPAAATVLVAHVAGLERDALEADLHALGHHVVTAATPLDCLRWLETAGSHLDTAVVDLAPGISESRDILDYLADHHPHVHRVLLSGHLRADQRGLALLSGRALAVLSKPWTRGSLREALIEQTA